MKKLKVLTALILIGASSLFSPTLNAAESGYQEIDTYAEYKSDITYFEAYRNNDYYHNWTAKGTKVTGKFKNEEKGANSTATGIVWVAKKGNAGSWVKVCGSDASVTTGYSVSCYDDNSGNKKKSFDVHGKWTKFDKKYNSITSTLVFSS